MNFFNLTFQINPTDKQNPLGFEAWLDDQLFYNCDQLTDSVEIKKQIPDDENLTHCLRFILKNKNSNHTVLDQQNNIIQDSLIEISDIQFDGIAIDNIFYEHAVYSHNFNGNADTVTDKFNRFMGCNGTVSMSFYTPVYVWILENM
jgi:hypothetical protein